MLHVFPFPVKKVCFSANFRIQKRQLNDVAESKQLAINHSALTTVGSLQC